VRPVSPVYEQATQLQLMLLKDFRNAGIAKRKVEVTEFHVRVAQSKSLFDKLLERKIPFSSVGRT
jgi:hypothetical protein